MTPAEVRKQIAAGATAPLFLLEGDDLQSRHDLALEFSGLVDEGLQAFNVESFYANEASAATARDQLMSAIVNTARTLPMMAPRRVIVVHEAERLLSPRKGRDETDEIEVRPEAGAKRRRAAPTPAEDLEAYLQSPELLTTLVFVAGALDANRRLVRLLRKHAVVVDCGSLDSAADAAKWVRARLEKDELTIEPGALNLLIGSTGLSLSRIRAEIEKLVLYASGESAITVAHVRDLVMPQNEPGEDFALGKAIWNGSAKDALREIAAQFEAGAQAPMVLGQIRAAAGRLRPDARIKSALDLILETDLSIKSSAGEPRYLLERLVIDICGSGAPSGPAWRR
jgi:DNA polymerase III delta subunit